MVMSKRCLDLLITGDAIGASQAYPLILQAAGILPDTSQVRLESGARYGLDFRSGAVGMLQQVRTGGRGFSAEVVQALRGDACTTDEGARDLERLVVDWIQHQIGKRLASADVYLDLI